MTPELPFRRVVEKSQEVRSIMEILDLFKGPIIIIHSRGEQGEVRIYVGNRLFPSMNRVDPSGELVKQAYELVGFSTTSSAGSTSS
jgi:hypothetical protein